MIIDIKDTDISLIEKQLLPTDCTFTNLQKSIIKSTESADVIAGPGCGKTTVLMAKIAIIYNIIKENNLNDAICVLTHTNVAVDEIRLRLSKVGINDFKYPHFIGTIHDFLNQFFTKKAHYSFFKNTNEITIIDDEEYKYNFIKYFNINKPTKYTYSPPLSKIKDTSLNRTEGIFTLIGECPAFYKEALIKTYVDILEKGLLRHDDILLLSKWYIEEFRQPLINAILKRFTYVFTDETQDSNLMQYDLLNSLFNEKKSLVQRFGDPYQSLFSIFSNEEDAWLPYSDSNINRLELAESTRFGSNISKVLTTTCIEEYTLLQGSKKVQSFKPHLILYDSIEKVIPEFAKIIVDLEAISEEFRLNSKKNYAIGLMHKEVARYNSKYSTPSKINAKKSNFTRECYDYLLILLIKFFRSQNIHLKSSDYSLKFIKDVLKKESSIRTKVEFAKIINYLYITGGVISDLIEEQIIEEYKNLMGSLNILNYNDKALRQILIENKDSFKNIYEKAHPKEDDKTNTVKEHNQKIHFGTVHSVKGETHKATLLLENKRTLQGVTNYDCSSIFNYLIGRYDEEEAKNKIIKDALKTAYVALSRPTHLAAVAICKSNLNELELRIKEAEHAGWTVIDIN